MATVTGLDQVTPQEIKFLWEPYIPRGKITFIEGDPGLGKSWFTLALASDLSCGRPLPGQAKGERTKKKVLLLSAEDGLDDTIVPRLKKLTACLENISAVREDDQPLILNEQGRAILGDLLRQHKPDVVIIDPLVAYMDGDLDMNRANQVRELMRGLSKLAEEHGCTIILVRHLKKGGGGKAIYQGLGSIDFTAAVRSVLMIFKDEDGETGDERVMTHAKCNVARLGPSLSFNLGEGFEWQGRSSMSADDLSGDPEARTAKLEAMDWTRERLAGKGWVPSADLDDERKKAGIAEATFKRGKRLLKREGLRVEQRPELGGGWFNCLPSAEVRAGN